MEDAVERAMNNTNNENITTFTYKKIHHKKNTILKELFETPTDLVKKLKDYRHVDELTEIRVGCYIRWIPTHTLKLTNGGIIIKIDLTESGINVSVKNNKGMIFTLKMDDNFVFQKITPQEHIILSVIDTIDKK